jgi:hypothetical protein
VLRAALRNIVSPTERRHQQEQLAAWKQKRNAALDAMLENRQRERRAKEELARFALQQATAHAKAHVRPSRCCCTWDCITPSARSRRVARSQDSFHLQCQVQVQDYGKQRQRQLEEAAQLRAKRNSHFNAPCRSKSDTSRVL